VDNRRHVCSIQFLNLEAHPAPRVVRVDEVAAVPWRNGGGVTRELLAWPDPRDWLLRVSVAEISASGAFSIFPGVDRWFAVLAGGGVRLETAGRPARELTDADPGLHCFQGDVATHCTAAGSTTRDFNLMAVRARLKLRARPLRESPTLTTRAAGVGLFVTRPVEVSEAGAAITSLAAQSLAWWLNPQRERRELRVTPGDVRGWWFEVETALP
jgi:uncharacterized protein